MKRLFIIIACFSTLLYCNAENYLETFNLVSDSCSNHINDIKILRNINGGTILSPDFDDSCPEEMKTPFEYACKIVEEYLSPCLPINIGISCDNLRGSSKDAISKVSFPCFEEFGTNPYYKNVSLSTIKGVLHKEMETGINDTYYEYIPNLEFLTEQKDILIVYNSQKLDEMSFSLEPEPGDKYDFVSVAIRDILIGLGNSSSFRYNPVKNELLDPVNNFLPFEKLIDSALGNSGNPEKRLEAATRGELYLGNSRLKLYAPKVWENGRSLKFFIPQEDNDLSQVLSYNFCKGMVTRSLNDDYYYYVCREMLGWKENVVVSIGGTSSETSPGGTSIVMPYNGGISFNENTPYRQTICNDNLIQPLSFSDGNFSIEAMDYINSFCAIDPYDNQVTSLAVLRKNGLWDTVYYIKSYEPSYPVEINMSDCEFHYDFDEYARTADGFLRARYATKYMERTGQKILNSTFFVMDYLPQKVSLRVKLMEQTQATTFEVNEVNSTASYPVRIYFSNFEGVDRIVLERLRSGFRMPSKIVVTDFKKGYFDTTIDRETTFTAVSYNNNGSSRGIPITISPNTEEVTSISFDLTDNKISLSNNLSNDQNYEYNIISIDNVDNHCNLSGITDGEIDISPLKKGIYAISVHNNKTGGMETFKFSKN